MKRGIVFKIGKGDVAVPCVVFVVCRLVIALFFECALRDGGVCVQIVLQYRKKDLYDVRTTLPPFTPFPSHRCLQHCRKQKMDRNFVAVIMKKECRNLTILSGSDNEERFERICSNTENTN